MSQWERQLWRGASELFSRDKNNKSKKESQPKEAELLQRIGPLQMEVG